MSARADQAPERAPAPSPGQVWRDRDPRSPHTVVVLLVDDEHVTIQRRSTKSRVKLRRFVRQFTCADSSTR